MAIKVNLEDYIKIQLSGATQTGVEFSGDTKIYREMTLSKSFDVYKCLPNGVFVSTKKFKIDKVRIAPDSLTIISVVSKNGDVLTLDEIGLEKNEVTIKYAEKLIEEGNSMVRRGTGILLSMVKNSVK